MGQGSPRGLAASALKQGQQVSHSTTRPPRRGLYQCGAHGMGPQLQKCRQRSQGGGQSVGSCGTCPLLPKGSGEGLEAEGTDLPLEEHRATITSAGSCIVSPASPSWL